MRIKVDHAAALFLLLFLGVSLVLLPHYGPHIDSQKNFAEGRAHAGFLLGQGVDREVLQWQMHGAFFFMIGDLSGRLFSDALGMLSPVTARHLPLPFLSTAFLFLLFRFLKRHLQPYIALLCVVLLATHPYFLGHAFNNLKDIPMLVFYSLALLSLLEWRRSYRLRFLYGFFFALGIALSIKLYATSVLAVVAVWFLITPARLRHDFHSNRPVTLAHAALAFIIMVIIVSIFYAPSFWALENKMEFLKEVAGRSQWLVSDKSERWKTEPLRQAFFKTPPLLIPAALAGMIQALGRGKTMGRLLLPWFWIPILIAVSPPVRYYNGIRHFLVFLVPLCILAGTGIEAVSGWVRKVSIPASRFRTPAALLLVCGNVFANIAYFPYQTSYFNFLAGGLPGAQQMGLHEATDYWLLSYREAAHWLEDHAAENAKVYTIYYSASPDVYNTDLLRYSLKRKDLRIERIAFLGHALRRSSFAALETGSYILLFSTNLYIPVMKKLAADPDFEEVYTIERQGGKLLSIFQKKQATG